MGITDKKRFSAQVAIDELDVEQRYELRKKAMIEIAFDTVGPSRAEQLRRMNALPTYKEFREKWTGTEAMLEVSLQSRVRDIYLREFGDPDAKQVALRFEPKDRDESGANYLDRAVAFVDEARSP